MNGVTPDMNKPPEDFLALLNTRSQDIFKRLVERYLETGAPVGSRDLSRLLSVGLSPASVRNVSGPRGPGTNRGTTPPPAGCQRRRGCGSSSTPCWRWGRWTSAGAPPSASRSRSRRHRGRSDLLTEASQLLSGLSHGAGGDRPEIRHRIAPYRIRAARPRTGDGGAGGGEQGGGKPHRAAAAG